MAIIRVIGPEGTPIAEVPISPAVSVLNALLAAGVPIRHECGGKALCGTCAVSIVSGSRGLSPIGTREAQRISIRGLSEGCRLACQTRAARDVDIEIPKE